MSQNFSKFQKFSAACCRSELQDNKVKVEEEHEGSAGLFNCLETEGHWDSWETCVSSLELDAVCVVRCNTT